MRPRAHRASALGALLRTGRRELVALVLLATVMAALGVLSLLSRLSVYGIAESPSAGDTIMWAFMGNPIGLSVEWGGLWCLLAVAGCPDVRGLMARMGQRLLVARGSRSGLWRDVCAACVVRALVTCASLAALSALLAVLLGGGASLALECASAASLGVLSEGLTASDVGLLLGLVCAGSVGLAVLGCALSVRCGRPLALVGVLALLLGSAFAPLLPLPGSWLMVSRLAGFAQASTVSAVWPPAAGFAVFAVIGILSFALGAWRFSRLEPGLLSAPVPWGGKKEGRRAAGARPSTLVMQARLGMRFLVPVAVLALAVCAMQCAGLVTRVRLYGPEGALPSLADFCAFALMGTSQPEPFSLTVSASRFVSIPFGWLVLVMLPQTFVCLLGMGAGRLRVALVLGGSRRHAWASRCVVAIVGTLLVVAVELLACLLAAVLAGGGLRLECSEWLADVSGLSRETLPTTFTGLPAFLACCACVQAALALLQMALGEYAGPVNGFLAVVVLLAASVFVMSPALLGNFLMCARSSVFVVPWRVEVQQGALRAGLDPAWGMVASAVAGALLYAAGHRQSVRRDYLGGSPR